MRADDKLIGFDISQIDYFGANSSPLVTEALNNAFGKKLQPHQITPQYLKDNLTPEQIEKGLLKIIELEQRAQEELRTANLALTFDDPRRIEQLERDKLADRLRQGDQTALKELDANNDGMITQDERAGLSLERLIGTKSSQETLEWMRSHAAMVNGKLIVMSKTADQNLTNLAQTMQNGEDAGKKLVEYADIDGDGKIGQGELERVVAGSLTNKAFADSLQKSGIDLRDLNKIAQGMNTQGVALTHDNVGPRPLNVGAASVSDELAR